VLARLVVFTFRVAPCQKFCNLIWPEPDRTWLEKANQVWKIFVCPKWAPSQNTKNLTWPDLTEKSLAPGMQLQSFFIYFFIYSSLPTVKIIIIRKFIPYLLLLSLKIGNPWRIDGERGRSSEMSRKKSKWPALFTCTIFPTHLTLMTCFSVNYCLITTYMAGIESWTFRLSFILS